MIKFEKLSTFWLIWAIVISIGIVLAVYRGEQTRSLLLLGIEGLVLFRYRTLREDERKEKRR